MEQMATTTLKVLLGVAALVLVSTGCVAFICNLAQKHHMERLEREYSDTNKLLEKAVRPDKPELLTIDQAQSLYEYRKNTAILMLNLTAASRMELETLKGNEQAFTLEHGAPLIEAELQDIRLASRNDLLKHLQKVEQMREARK